MDKCIVIMAGGTGGHVFPALAVAQSLQDKGWRVSWMGTQRGLENRVVPENGIALDWLSVSGLRGKGRLAVIKAPLMLMKACMEALTILRRRKPDVVLGMGGFVAGPGGLMSRVLGIPLVIHEQNRIPGTTNRLLARIAKVVLQAFPDSFPARAKAVCTGNPLRKEFVTTTPPTDVNKGHNILRILVVGGSQGAKILNEIVPQSLALLDDVEVKHQTGAIMQEQVQKQYAALGVKAEVLAFIDDMVLAYRWADMIICRSGAMTISEVSAMGLPSILVPFPYAIDDHQTANAKFLADANAGILMAQSSLSAESLADQVKLLQQHLTTMSEAARKCSRLEATEAVAAICMNEASA